ncbi:MAG: response regulator [Methylophaga sp.]|jgi:DNA-binding response OmpR family regulator|nr:response regulator [Methylophaga sp.]
MDATGEGVLTKKRKILVVDDNTELRMLISLTLEFSYWQLLEADNAETGLAMLKQHKPDIVLLDVMMPGEQDGLALCRTIRADESLDGIRIIMLSAKGQQKDVQLGLEAGADDYVVKPFSPSELMEKLDIELDFDNSEDC